MPDMYPYLTERGIDFAAESGTEPELQYLLGLLGEAEYERVSTLRAVRAEAESHKLAAERVIGLIEAGREVVLGLGRLDDLRAMERAAGEAAAREEKLIAAYKAARDGIRKLRAAEQDWAEQWGAANRELTNIGRGLERMNGRCGELQRENDQLEAVNHALREDLADARKATEDERRRADRLQQDADGVNSQFGALVEKLESAGMVGPRQLDDARDTIVEAVVARWQNIRP
jgi:chromosome segregation ATPase